MDTDVNYAYSHLAILSLMRWILRHLVGSIISKVDFCWFCSNVNSLGSPTGGGRVLHMMSLPSSFCSVWITVFVIPSIISVSLAAGFVLPHIRGHAVQEQGSCFAKYKSEHDEPSERCPNMMRPPWATKYDSV